LQAAVEVVRTTRTVPGPRAAGRSLVQIDVTMHNE
jgi:hypothetical protein